MNGSEHAPTRRRGWSLLTVYSLVLLVALLAVGGWFGYRVFTDEVAALSLELSSTQAQVAETRELLTLLAEGNQDLRVQLKAEEMERAETTEAIEEMSAEREVLTSQLINLEQELSTQREELTPVDVTKVVDHWNQRVARIECSFLLSGGRSAKSVGSAVATYENGELVFVTNEHVITGQSDLVPQSCTMTMPDSDQAITIEGTSATLSADRDIAWLKTGAATRVQGVSGPLRQCQSQPSIGDELIILGYPSVGSIESVTATEGIISGFDRGLFVTSAKIERGNSGGAAIHLKNDCFLGIPTLVVVGEIESLARIMPLP